MECHASDYDFDFVISYVAQQLGRIRSFAFESYQDLRSHCSDLAREIGSGRQTRASLSSKLSIKIFHILPTFLGKMLTFRKVFFVLVKAFNVKENVFKKWHVDIWVIVDSICRIFYNSASGSYKCTNIYRIINTN